MAFINLLAALVLSLTNLQQGEQLFLDNKPREALPHLEKALYENPQDEKIYLYLGIIYEQLNDPAKSIQILKRGLNVSKGSKDLFYYNLGNNHFRQQEYTVAEHMYSNALEINGALEVAYLNRANARLELEQFQEARQVILCHGQDIAFLRFATPDFHRTHGAVLVVYLSQVECAARLRHKLGATV